jgi:parallel beta-helix repeat protein
MESTDSYVADSEIWADKRSFAIHLVKSSQFIRGNQLVGSSVKGSLWVEDTKDNYDIELIRVVDNFFDGNNQGLDTGSGVYAVRMRNSRVNDNDFWWNKDEGIRMVGCRANSILGNQFENNNRRDAGKDDIYMENCALNSVIGNTYKRDMTHSSKGSPVKTVSSSGRNLITGNTVDFSSYYSSSSFSSVDTVKFNAGISDNAIKTSLSVFSSSALTATVGAETKLTFNAKDYDNTGEFSTSTGVFTALSRGVYSVRAAVQFNSQQPGNRTILIVYKNGVGFKKVYDGNTSNSNSSASGGIDIDLVAGDALSIYYYTAGTANITAGSKETYLSIAKVYEN